MRLHAPAMHRHLFVIHMEGGNEALSLGYWSLQGNSLRILHDHGWGAEDWYPHGEDADPFVCLRLVGELIADAQLLAR